MPAPEHSNVEEFPYIGEKFDIVDIVGEVSFDELFEGRVEMPAPIDFSWLDGQFDYSKIEEAFPGLDNLMDEMVTLEDLFPEVNFDDILPKAG